MDSPVIKVKRAVETLIVVLVAVMVALTFFDVIGRRIFGRPIYGANDVTEHLMGLMVFAGLPIVTAAGAHLTVDIFDKLLDRPIFRYWRAATAGLVAAILFLIAWLFVEHALNAGQIKEVSQALRIPRKPIYFYMAASCALSAVAVIVTFFKGPLGSEKSETGL